MRGRAGNPIIFDAGVRAHVAAEIRLNVVEIEIVADVAVKLAVIRVTRKAFPRRPDLLRAPLIAPERGDAGWRINRRIDAIKRRDAGMIDSDRFHEEESNFFPLQDLIQARKIGAFRQPHPLRAETEHAFEIF